MIGENILHYRIIEEIGRGGMGIVYKAEDTKLKREIAIKFLPQHAANGEEERKRFLIEAQAAAALNHPNIATIYAIEEVDEKMFIVMEYIDGQELKQKIDAGPMPLDEALEIAGQMAEGLKVAHEKGVVHRDIKSSNIMLTATCQVKIMDFGLARIGEGSQITKTGTTRGTAAYMSPQQVLGKEVDRRTDIWSFGVVLYEMLTGQLPFNGVYEQAVFYSIMNEEPKPITTLRPGIPVELEDIICIALAKEPADRYSDADELITDLQGFMMSLKTGMQGLGTIQRTQHRRISPVVIAGIIFLLVAFVSIGVYFQFLSRGKKIKEPVEITQSKLAVLPFRDLSPNNDLEHLCDAMTIEIIGKLIRIKLLKVTPFTSVQRYKNSKGNIKQIGEELGATAILEGSLQKENDSIRVNVRLINVSDESHLWQDMYDNEQGSVFAIQDDISQAIVDALEIELLKDEKIALKKHHTRNAEAYNLYTLGRFYRKDRGGDLLKSIDYYKKALEKDPNYALAYAGLADACRVQAEVISLDYNKSYEVVTEWYLKARDFAGKALELDDTLAEAHIVLGLVKLHYEWDFKGAKKEFQRAIEINPRDAYAHSRYSRYFLVTDDWNNAIAEGKRAQELGRLNYAGFSDLGMTFIWAGKYDRAIEQLKIAKEMAPGSLYIHLFLAMSYLEKSMYEEALEELKIQEEGAFPFFARFVKMFLYARKGEKEKLREFVENEKKSGSQTSPFWIAASYAELGESDQVFAWLEKAYKQRDPVLILIQGFPYFKNYRTDPRFKAILKKMGLD
jgi:TolB-like protein/predicted Ser/Thr protein kinase/Tfp pilus assembly protein PilF